MKKHFKFILSLILFLQIAPVAHAQESPLSSIASQSYILMDSVSGQIIAQKNSREQHFPASITKIMTTALALEHYGMDWSAQLTVSGSALAAVGEGSSSIFLQSGEVLTLSDALHATMLASANDSANVLAEAVAGSMEVFVEMMNQKALSLGMIDTHFSNPSGWHEDSHYTTAYDMAKLTQWALTVPGFCDLWRVSQYTMPPTNKHFTPRIFENDNLLLSGPMHYSGILGGKSGWTPESRFTMVETVQRDGHTLIAVVLDCPRKLDRYQDCASLFDYCFTNFHVSSSDILSQKLPPVPVFRGSQEIGTVPLIFSSSFFIPNGCSLENIRMEYSISKQYVLDKPFSATATLYMESDSITDICVLPVFPDPTALASLLTDEVQSKKAPDGRQLFLIGILFAFLAALLSFRASRLDAIRRRAAVRSLSRMRQFFPSAASSPSSAELMPSGSQQAKE